MTVPVATPSVPKPLFVPDPQMPAPRRRKRLRKVQIIHRVLLGLVLLIQVYPFMWLILTSVRSPEDFAANNPFGIQIGRASCRERVCQYV